MTGPAAAQAAGPYRGAQTALVAVPGRPASAAVETPPPKTDLSPILAPLNEIRKRAGVGALSWSNALAADANRMATAASAECSYSSSKKALGSTPSIFYWATSVRRIDGEAVAQDLLPSFVVAEWRRGGGDYNSATGVCRRAGNACSTYSRIAAPLARSVGCARVVCPSQSQVWVCKFGDS